MTDETTLEDVPRLTVAGADLIKPNGARIRLRGENWGSWQQAEEHDADDAKALGANVIRLPLLRWWGLYDRQEIEARDDKGYAAIRRANIERSMTEIAWIVKRKLWIVPFIDTNCGQSGTQSPQMQAYCDPYGVFGATGRNCITDLPSRQIYKGVWKAGAQFLKRVPRVAAYEITPEPLDGRGAEWAAPLRDYWRDMIGAIEEVDKTTPYLLGARGAYEATHCDEAWLSERTDCLYTGNVLSYTLTHPDKLDEALSALADMQDRRHVPMLLQQVGRRTEVDRNLEHMRAALAKINAARRPDGVPRFHWTWWQRRDGSASPDEYGLRYKDGAGGWITKDNEVALLSEFLRAEG